MRKKKPQKQTGVKQSILGNNSHPSSISRISEKRSGKGKNELAGTENNKVKAECINNPRQSSLEKFCQWKRWKTPDTVT